MRAVDVLRRLGEAFDDHRWDVVPALLHDDLEVEYLHTGERFDKDAFCRVNAEYPGFVGFTWQDLVDAGDRAAGIGLVTGTGDDGSEERYAVASFATVRDGLIVALAEVWTDVRAAPPEGRRPEDAP